MDYLIKHAVDNVWCHPDQDDQVILAVKRISLPAGVIGSAQVMTRRVKLPQSNKIYHLFQIGQVLPEVIGLLDIRPLWGQTTWVKFTDAINTKPLYCDIYTDDGVQISLFSSYYLYTSERALIVAIEDTAKLPVNFREEQIYLRLYTNAFFNSTAAQALEKLTVAEGKVVQSSAEIIAMQSSIMQFASKPGAVMSFLNGNLVKNITPITASLGDHAEYVYDASVKRIVDIPIARMQSFLSLLDDCHKYLVHYQGGGDQVIDYMDDIDFYIVHKSGDKEFGRYYHRNRLKSVRMVTHRDYSLAVDHVRDIGLRLLSDLGKDSSEYPSLVVRLYIRNSGLVRPLVFEHNRVFELYKMKDEDVLDAMIGTVVRVPVWRVENLESSAYTELMRTKYKSITREMVEGAYGYSAISKLLGDGPIKTSVQTGTLHSAELPYGARTMSTVYEYSADGKLNGSYAHNDGTVYYVKNGQSRLVEPVLGTGTHDDVAIYADDDILLEAPYSYRVYMCYKEAGIPSGDWRDITDSDLYRVENSRVKWSGTETDQHLMVKSDKKFLAYSFTQRSSNGTLFFDLTERVGGVVRQLQVPPGDLDIWINGNLAIMGLDYLVKFPTVHIVNRRFLIQPFDSALQSITVRGRGFCKPDLSFESKQDYGFIEHGVLSNNNRFDLRDDKVLRIVCGGSLKHRSDVLFSETTSGVSITNALNGTPYQVKMVTVPLRGHTDQETYEMRREAVEIDDEISAFLTTKIPQPERDAVSAIPTRWPVFSPFLASIIYGLQMNHFDHDRLRENLDRNDVEEMCQPYVHFLETDPLNPDLNYDPNYTVVHATGLNRVVQLDLYKYKFLQMVVAYYGRGLVSIDSAVSISLAG